MEGFVRKRYFMYTHLNLVGVNFHACLSKIKIPIIVNLFPVALEMSSFQKCDQIYSKMA
jgi:hypothetical protein